MVCQLLNMWYRLSVPIKPHWTGLADSPKIRVKSILNTISYVNELDRPRIYTTAFPTTKNCAGRLKISGTSLTTRCIIKRKFTLAVS